MYKEDKCGRLITLLTAKFGAIRSTVQSRNDATIIVIKETLTTLREDGIAVFVQGASQSLLVSVLATGIGFLSTVVLTRHLGADGYGLYVYVLSWVAVLSLFAQLGFRPALVRFIAAYAATEQWALARGVLAYTTSISIGTSVLLSMIVGLIAWLIRDRLGADGTYAFLIALPLIVLITAASLRAAALRALKRVVLSAIPESVIRPILVASGVALCAYVMDEAVTASDALIVNVGATFCVFLLGTFLLLKVLPPLVKTSSPEYAKRKWWRTSLPMFFSIGMRTMLSQADVLLVGTMLGVRQAGIYAVASRLAGFAILPKQAADSITAPMISELYATEERLKLSRLVIIAARSVTGVTLGAGLFLILFGMYILNFFGPDFTEGFLPLLILLLGHLFKASFASAGFLLSMTGHQDQSAIISSVSAVLNVILLLILIPLFGLVGAALAAAISNAIWSLALAVFAWRLLQINPTAFAKIPTSSMN